MNRIDEGRLETDLEYRFGYLTEFIGFDAEDVAAVHAASSLLAPLVPGLVDAVYDKLFSYDATKRHFVPRQSGYEGELPQDIDSLDQQHPQIAFRKAHLAKYLVKLVSDDYDGRLVSYLDRVGAIHTPAAGNADLDVPLVQMNALMGFVSDAILGAILGMDLDETTKARTIRAFGKLLWIQNDLISRHYVSAGMPVG